MAIDRLKYQTDRCFYEIEGKRYAKEYFEKYMHKLFSLDDQALLDLSLGQYYEKGLRINNILKLLKAHINLYHSDYRWDIKIYEITE